MNALNLIRNLLQKWIGSTLQVPGVSERALEDHKAIFFAIAKKNAAAAPSAMMSHLEDMARFFVQAQEKSSQATEVGRGEEVPLL